MSIDTFDGFTVKYENPEKWFSGYDTLHVEPGDVLTDAAYIWKDGTRPTMIWCDLKLWRKLRGHRGRSQSHIRKLEKQKTDRYSSQHVDCAERSV